MNSLKRLLIVLRRGFGRRFINPSLLERNRSYFRSIKGIHKGSRGFVIGNGPSLRISDLTALKQEICIASNRIYLAYDQTEWRPSYYTVADNLVWEKFESEIGRTQPEVIIPSSLVATRNIKKIRMFEDLIREGSEDENWFSADFEKGAFGGSTVTYHNIQLACHLGLNPIYVIGCDHYYSGSNEKGQRAVVESSANNHFVKNYRAKGEKVNSAPISAMNKAYARARKATESLGADVFNATRGGHLETFVRKPFDEIEGIAASGR